MRTVFYAIIILTFSILANAQTTWYVPDDFPTIQGAISDPLVVNGDTVIVKPGTYVENIDFLGKAITVKSSGGVEATIIDGSDPVNPDIKSTVVFNKSESHDSVLEGFTVTNGTGTLYEIEPGGWYHCGGGIYCRGAAPTINSCRIIENVAFWGGGLFVADDASPTLTNCIIAGNIAPMCGGGFSTHYSSTTVFNCTIYGNWGPGGGGGICHVYSYLLTVTNSILWANVPDQILSSSSTSPIVTFCDIEHGYPGTGNIDTDPLFVDHGNWDIHLTYCSPCKDTGDNSAVTELYDFEGDPRIAYSTVDMGADEFYTHLYVTGDTTPGGNIEGKFVGLPGTTPVGLWFGSGELDPPIPSVFGDWYLEFPWIGPIVLGSIPSPDGILVLPATLPATPPAPYDLFMQALIGDELTNLYVLEVR